MKVDVYDSLGELPDAVQQACRYPSQDDFFSTLDWFECLYETVLADSITPRIYIVSGDDGQPLAALFCTVEERRRTLGSLSNYYALEFGPVLFDGCADVRRVIGQLVAFIAGERPRWDRVDLRLTRPDRPECESLQAHLADSGFRVYPSLQYENWYLNLHGRTFEAYYSERPSKMKNTIARKEKKLRRVDDLEIRLVTEPGPELEDALADYIAIYNNSWKEPEPYPAFIPALVRLCARLGLLRLGVLYKDKEPLAAQLWITTARRRAIIYKLAYDERHKKLSAGSILSRDLFRHAIDTDRVEEIDYGIGSESYKKDWMESERSIHRIEAYSVKTLTGLRLSAVQTTKNLIKPFVGRSKRAV